MSLQQLIAQRNLDISIVELKNLWLFSRIDSDCYSIEYIRNEKQILNKNGWLLQSYIKHITWWATPLWANYLDIWVPFLRVQNIMQNYFNLNDVVYISERDDKKLKRSKVKIWDVLLTITWVSYWKSATVDESVAWANINQHSVKIELKENSINPFYLSTFLNSKFWKFQSDKNIVWLSRPALDYTAIKEFQIPIPNINFQQKIADLIEASQQKRQQSKSLYHQAEQLLLSELGLENYQPTENTISIKNSDEVGVFSRMDAEFFQPKYDEIIEKIKGYKWWRDILDNLFSQNKSSMRREKEAYNYIEIWDINTWDWTIDYNLIPTEELPANAKICLKQWDLLISKVRPYRWAIGIIYDRIDDLIWSWAFTVLQEKTDFKKETLTVLLRTWIYKDLMMRYNSGVSYPVIKDEDVLNLPIPKVFQSIQQKIAELVTQSHQARNKSKKLLEVAKRAVEVFIEEDEAKAMEFISKNG